MLASPPKSMRAVFAASLLAALVVSACTTKPDRKGPPPDGARSGQQPRSSGTFLHPVAALFVSMDLNNDKTTSRTELSEGIALEWASFDRNPSQIYYMDWATDTLGNADAMPNFISFDRNLDGVITQAEFSERIEQRFDALDKDKDGNLLRSEMIVAIAPRQSQSGQSGRQESGSRGGRGGQRERSPQR